jgi:hypothetical protein
MNVVESARDHIQVGFGDYARYGIPITILTAVAGVVVLLVLRQGGLPLRADEAMALRYRRWIQTSSASEPFCLALHDGTQHVQSDDG